MSTIGCLLYQLRIPVFLFPGDHLHFHSHNFPGTQLETWDDTATEVEFLRPFARGLQGQRRAAHLWSKGRSAQSGWRLGT